MVAVGLDILDPRIIRPHHRVDPLVGPIRVEVSHFVRVELPRDHDTRCDHVWPADKYDVGDLVHCVLHHGAAVFLRFRAPNEAKFLDERLHGARLHDANVSRHGGEKIVSPLEGK